LVNPWVRDIGTLTQKYSFSSSNIAASSMAINDCINFDLTTNPWTGYQPFQSASPVNSLSGFAVMHIFYKIIDID
jgi:hypothetical protein